MIRKGPLVVLSSFRHRLARDEVLQREAELALSERASLGRRDCRQHAGVNDAPQTAAKLPELEKGDEGQEARRFPREAGGAYSKLNLAELAIEARVAH